MKRSLRKRKEITPIRSKLYSFIVDLSLRGACRAVKKTDHYKSYLSWWKWRNIHQVYPVSLTLSLP